VIESGDEDGGGKDADEGDSGDDSVTGDQDVVLR
jgi:hypothetical protein